MATPHITHDEFQKLLPMICTRETSADSAGWTPENPLYAHCAVVALLAQDVFGGALCRASLLPFPEFAHMGSHYWNVFPDGSERDFTTPQFCGHRPDLIGEARTRTYVLVDPHTGQLREIASRYALLLRRYIAARAETL